MNQQTIRDAVSFGGVGLHTGERTTITFRPAGPEQGVSFVRSDLPGRPRIRVCSANAVDEKNGLRRTILRGEEGAEVHTVEHVLAAITGLGIDNIEIEIDGCEAPEPADGSAAPLAELLAGAGIVEQAAERKPFVIRKPVRYEAGPVEIIGLPGEGFRLGFTIQFDNCVVGTQHCCVAITPETFRREIAPARTFVLHRDVEQLRERGMIKGGSLQNAIVVEEEGILNSEPLRFPDEFVRHKILDLIGDIYLLNRPVMGKISARHTGHMENIALVKELKRLFY